MNLPCLTQFLAMALTVFTRLYRRLGPPLPVGLPYGRAAERLPDHGGDAGPVQLLLQRLGRRLPEDPRRLAGPRRAWRSGSPSLRTLPLMRPIQEWIAGARDARADREGLGGGRLPAAGADPQRPRDPDLVAIVPGVHLGRDRARPVAGLPSSRCSRARWSPSATRRSSTTWCSRPACARCWSTSTNPRRRRG